MKKTLLFPATAFCTLLLATSPARSNDYQFIAPEDSGPILWADAPGLPFHANDSFWNANAPWSATPPSGRPGAADRLDLAAGNNSRLQLNNGGTDIYVTYELSQLTVGSDAGGRSQIIAGHSATRAILDVGGIVLDGNASLSFYRGHTNARLLVEASTVEIAQGSALYLGSNATTSSSTNALDGFQVSGTTEVNGSLYSHFQNRNGTGSFQFGDLTLGSAGAVYLLNAISITGSGEEVIVEYQARSLSGEGNIHALAAAAPNNRAITAELTVATGAATDEVFSGVLANAAQGLDARNTKLTLTLSGSGRQSLTGTNTYTGATTLEGGTLLLEGSGSINASSAIVIDGGDLIQNSSVALAVPVTWKTGGIGGTGTITGDLTTADGGAKTLTPGDDGGTLTIAGNLTLDSDTTVRFRLNGLTAGTDYGLLSVDGQLGLGNALLDVEIAYSATVNDQFTIAGFGSRDGTFDGLADQALFNAGSYTLQIGYGMDDITLKVVAIPEPGPVTLLGLVALAAGMGIFGRHRRSN